MEYNLYMNVLKLAIKCKLCTVVKKCWAIFSSTCIPQLNSDVKRAIGKSQAPFFLKYINISTFRCRNSKQMFCNIFIIFAYLWPAFYSLFQDIYTAHFLQLFDIYKYLWVQKMFIQQYKKIPKFPLWNAPSSL